MLVNFWKSKDKFNMKCLLSCEIMTQDMGFKLSTKKSAFNQKLESRERLLGEKGKKKLNGCKNT
jgi:hypothetical protein